MRLFIACVLATIVGVTSVSAANYKGTLKRIDDTGVIKIGYRETEPPLSFKDPSGKITGYSIDLCTRIASAVRNTLSNPDIKIEFVPVTATTRFSAIEQGEIDILCGATTKTLGRSERVDFTDLTFITGASLMSLRETPVRGITDLDAKKVAVVRDTTTIAVLGDAIEAALVSVDKIVGVETAAEGIEMLNNGEVDAFASDQVVLLGLIATSPNPNLYSLSPEIFSTEPFALAVARNDADFRLVANRAIAQVYRSGQIIEIYRRWFSAFGLQPPALLGALYRLHATPE